MNYEQEQDWIASIQLRAQGGGDAAFYNDLLSQINARRSSWKHKDEGGEFDSTELTKLIQAADSLNRFIIIRGRP